MLDHFLMIQTFKTDDRNEPRFFANSAFIDDEGTSFEKGVFYYM